MRYYWYSNLICIVLVFVGRESRGSQRCSQKAKSVRTDHRTCCQNLSWHRLWKAGTVLWKYLFTCFLILPDEFIDNQIDNLAIAKNCRGPGQPETQSIPGVAHFNFASMSWNIYLGWSSLALKLTIVKITLILKIKRDEQNLKKQKARNSPKTKMFWGNSFRTLKTNSGQQTADHAVPLFLILWRWMEIDVQINSHCLTCSKTM